MSGEINPALPSGYNEVITDVYKKHEKSLGKFSGSIFDAISDVCGQLKPKNFNLGNLYSAFCGAINHVVNKITTTIAKFAYDLADKLIKFFKSTGVTTENKREALMSSVSTMADSSENDIRINDYLGNYMMKSAKKGQPWCADTVRTFYTSIPGMDTSLEAEIKDFHSVPAFQNWGKKKGLYTETSKMKTAARSEYISKKVKPGDIMIEKINKSHMGIVVEVYPNGYTDPKTGNVYPPGSFKTVEGNTKTGLDYRIWPPNSPTLSGFIDMSGYLDSRDAVAEVLVTEENAPEDKV